MPTWGTDPNSTDQKPNYLREQGVGKYLVDDSYATNRGWVMRAGSPATGNGNINAAPEILVAIGNLAGRATNAGFKLESYTHDSVSDVGSLILDSTNGTANAGDDLLLEAGDGLGTPNPTAVRFVTDIPAAGSSKTVTVEITWDEAVTVAGTPQVTCVNGNEGTGAGRTCVLSYTATGSSANRKRFTATNITVAADDVITLGAADQLALNSGTISDTEMGGTSVPVFLDLSDITAVTQTIA
jgi:hypothetical protein